MTEILHSREKTNVQNAILDLFAQLTGLPISLYEERGKDLVQIESTGSLANFEEHCKLIQTFPGGKAACDADQCSRAHRAIKANNASVAICHAGMYNNILPIKVKGEVRGALLYGEMQIDTPKHRQAALEKHQDAVKRLGLTSDQAKELQSLLQKAKSYQPEKLESYKELLTSVEKWFYMLIDAEDQVTFGVERVTHEIQTRLQAIIGYAENLTRYIQSIPKDEATKMARNVLSSAMALDTVIQTLGGYLGEYKFKPHSIVSVLKEAKRIYESEATQRGIQIMLDPVPIDRNAAISQHHFQHAINNLVHNAVKYSFKSGTATNPRFVRISLMPSTYGYQIAISNYGVGILPEEIETRAIFQKDYQGQLTQGEFRTGGGKGLFFADSVIRRHHGRIEVTSKQVSDEQSPEGQPHHNRFTVFIPYRQPEDSL